MSILYNKYCTKDDDIMMLIRKLFIMSIMYFIILLSMNSFEEIVANTLFYVDNKNKVDDCVKENDDSAWKKIFNYILLVFILLFLIAFIILHSIPYPALIKLSGDVANGLHRLLSKFQTAVLSN